MSGPPYDGATVQWRHDTMVRPYDGVMIQRYDRTMVPQYDGAAVRRTTYDVQQYNSTARLHLLSKQVVSK